MKYRQLLVFIMLLAVVAFSTSGCKKRKARKTLEGDWNIVSYNLSYSSECNSGYGEALFIEVLGEYGEAHFEKKTFDLTFTFEKEYVECDLDTVKSYSGDWKVLDHQRQFLIGHEYQVELDGKTWDLTFGSANGGLQKADGQDLVYLGRVLPNGDYEYLDLVRQ